MPKTKSSQQLTDKQRAFVEFYLISWNAADAAKKAGYSDSSARQIGSQNLSKLYIRSFIEKRMEEQTLSANEVLARLSDHARGTLDDFLDEAGHLSISQARENRKMHLVRKYKETSNTKTNKDGSSFTTITHEIELYDGQRALVHLGQYRNLFANQINVVTWQDRIIDALRSGAITPEAVEKEFGPEIATELFERGRILYRQNREITAPGAAIIDNEDSD